MQLRILWALVLFGVLLAYSNHFHNTFHFADFHTVENNPAIRDLKNLPLFFTDPGTFSVLATNRAWRPLQVTSLAFDYWLGKQHPVMRDPRGQSNCTAARAHAP